MTGAKFDIEKFDGTGDFGLWRARWRALIIQYRCEAAREVLHNLAEWELQAKAELNKKAHSAVNLRSKTRSFDFGGVMATLNSKEIKERSKAKGDDGEGLYVRGRTDRKGFAFIKKGKSRIKVSKKSTVRPGKLISPNSSGLTYDDSEEIEGDENTGYQALLDFNMDSGCFGKNTGHISEGGTTGGCEKHGLFGRKSLGGRHLTVSGMPQQNGVAERMNKTLMDKKENDPEENNTWELVNPPAAKAESSKCKGVERGGNCETEKEGERKERESWRQVDLEKGVWVIFNATTRVVSSTTRRRKWPFTEAVKESIWLGDSLEEFGPHQCAVITSSEGLLEAKTVESSECGYCNTMRADAFDKVGTLDIKLQ
ncbi:hypothetical protein Tco_0873340 [Tanacetum coccineum]